MTLVFLHPIGLDGDCWRLLDAELLAGAIRYDLPAHGSRPRPAGGFGIADLADDVARSVPGALDVIGLSMGGAVAQELALRHPERVRSLLLACSTAGGRGGRSQQERAEAVEAGGMAGVLEDTLDRWFTPAALADPADPGVAYTRDRLLRDDPVSFAASWRALARHDTVERLGSITARTTVLHAESDAASGIETKHIMIERIPDSRLELVPGPHMVQLERPVEFGRAVRSHLEWVDS